MQRCVRSSSGLVVVLVVALRGTEEGGGGYTHTQALQSKLIPVRISITKEYTHKHTWRKQGKIDQGEKERKCFNNNTNNNNNTDNNMIHLLVIILSMCLNFFSISEVASLVTFTCFVFASRFPPTRLNYRQLLARRNGIQSPITLFFPISYNIIYYISLSSLTSFLHSWCSGCIIK